MDWMSLIPPAAALVLAPLLMSVIARTKAMFAGRRGQPLLQPYFDIVKLLRKGATYSRTTTWVFRAGPVAGLAAAATAVSIVPLGSLAAPAAFAGDLLIFVGLLALMRFLTVLSALDTGSSFEGMGASREVFFSALAEPALLLGLAALVRLDGTASLSGIVAASTPEAWVARGPALALVALSLGIVLLAENSRIPVDDPNTHLELTMIHEVMVLDHGGPDLAFIEYASSLKLWAFCAIFAGLVVPVRTSNIAVDAAAFLVGIALTAVGIGVVESTMARLRLRNVPVLLAGAASLSVLALVLVSR